RSPAPPFGVRTNNLRNLIMSKPWYSSLFPPRTPRPTSSPGRRSGSRRSRPRLEVLEGRELLATFAVTNANDSGHGSLPDPTAAANNYYAAYGGTQTVVFDIGSGPVTISLQSALPAIKAPVTLDGATQRGYSYLPVVVIDGTNAPGAVGLDLQGSGSTVNNLSIVGFSGDGVHVEGSNNTLAGDFFGFNTLTYAAQANANGVVLQGGAQNNSLSGDSFNWNLNNGLVFSGLGTSNNTV